MQTVDRALAVLNVVLEERGPVALDRISALTGLHRSVVYRLLRSLEYAGYVARREEVGGYGLGATLIASCFSVTKRFDIGSVVRPTMDQIVEEFGETASLHMQNSEYRVCIEVSEGTHPIRRVIPVGERHLVYVGETGRALLASMTQVEASAQIEKAAIAGHDAEAIQAGVQQTIEQGYFIGVGTRTAEVGAISIPIPGFYGTRLALTISGPASRWNEAAMRAAAPRIVEMISPVKQKISREVTVSEPGQ